MKYNFKYFNNDIIEEYFEKEECEICGKESHCIPTGELFFDEENEELEEAENICLDCFFENIDDIEVDDMIIEELENNIEDLDLDLTEEEIEERIEEFKRTPPVMWIQENEWPVCCGDFCKFIGEWKQEDFNKIAPDGNGKEYMANLLKEYNVRNLGESDYELTQEDIDCQWDGLEGDAYVFMFKCLSCNKYIAIFQCF